MPKSLNIKVTVASIICTFFIFLPKLSGIVSLCFDYRNSTQCTNVAEDLFNMSIFFIFVTIFSLITYFMPPVTFTAWWRFARIAIPVILLISLALNLELHHSAYGDLQNIFDIPILVTLYTVFILGSVWQIVRNRG